MCSRAEKIKAVVFDVDGVMTDGRLGYMSDGTTVKFFNVRDCAGIVLLRKVGLKVAWLTGRSDESNRKRAEELKIDLLKDGCHYKADGLREAASCFGVDVDECAYVGDDLIDLPALEIAGLPVAVGDACDEVKACSCWIMEHPGGGGAVREFCEKLLKAMGIYERALKVYRGEQ